MSKMITKDSIESAYCFFHQKWRVYKFSHDTRQREDIEYAISSYVESMDTELYRLIARGKGDFLTTSPDFRQDLPIAIQRLEDMMGDVE